MRPILLVGIGLLTGCFEALPFFAEEPSSEVRASASDPDLCDEHGVLESVCTRCNPRLAPVFQARGDWCDEHGFPESFCPICSPEAGGRPAVADLSVDAAPADGTVVRFKTRDAAALTGLQIAEAEEAPWTGGVEAVVRLEHDATRVALVSARTAGVVQSIEADVGTRVQAGAVLARLRSAHVGGDRSRVAAARQALQAATTDLRRKQELLQAGVSSEQQVLAAQRVQAAARAELGAIQSELGLVGAGSGDAFAVSSPLAGIVVERHASIGQAVEPSAPLFQVVDPSRLWAELDVPETELGAVREGQIVRITLDGLPDRVLEGRLAYLAPAIDARSRTARGRVVLDNPDGALRARMYGTARIITDHADSVVTVPEAAVQPAEGVHLVFLKEAEDRFVARRVRVLARSGGRVRIEGPIQPGDRVVTTGSFLLKTETLKDSIGAGCCDVE